MTSRKPCKACFLHQTLPPPLGKKLFNSAYEMFEYIQINALQPAFRERLSFLKKSQGFREFKLFFIYSD